MLYCIKTHLCPEMHAIANIANITEFLLDFADIANIVNQYRRYCKYRRLQISTYMTEEVQTGRNPIANIADIENPIANIADINLHN